MDEFTEMLVTLYISDNVEKILSEKKNQEVLHESND